MPGENCDQLARGESKQEDGNGRSAPGGRRESSKSGDGGEPDLRMDQSLR